MKQIAEAHDEETAQRMLVQARGRAEGFGKSDPKSGYFRSYYLSGVARAQVGNARGAAHSPPGGAGMGIASHSGGGRYRSRPRLIVDS